MELDIAAQGRTLLLCLSLGMGGGLLYDLLRAVRLRRRSSAPLTHLLDALFVLAAAWVLLYLCAVKGGGALRIYMVAGLVLGAVFWFALPSGYCRELWDAWAEAAVWAVRLFLTPVRWAAAAVKKSAPAVKKGFLFCRRCATMGEKRTVRTVERRRRKGAAHEPDPREKEKSAPAP